MKMLLGGVLIAAGILIAGASGVCSLYMLFMPTAGSAGERLSILPMILAFGGIPFALGMGLLLWGWSVVRRARGGEN
jgi:hypothetical protein